MLLYCERLYSFQSQNQVRIRVGISEYQNTIPPVTSWRTAKCSKQRTTKFAVSATSPIPLCSYLLCSEPRTGYSSNRIPVLMKDCIMFTAKDRVVPEYLPSCPQEECTMLRAKDRWILPLMPHERQQYTVFRAKDRCSVLEYYLSCPHERLYCIQSQGQA